MNSLTQKEVDNFIKMAKMVSFLTKQTNEKKAFIENKKRGIKYLHSKVNNIKLFRLE